MKIGLEGVEDEAGRALGRLSQARRNPGKKQEADQGPLITEWTLVEVEGVQCYQVQLSTRWVWGLCGEPRAALVGPLCSVILQAEYS